MNCSPQQRTKEKKKTSNAFIPNFRNVRKKLNFPIVHPLQIETRLELTKYRYLTIKARLVHQMNILHKSSSVLSERQKKTYINSISVTDVTAVGIVITALYLKRKLEIQS